MKNVIKNKFKKNYRRRSKRKIRRRAYIFIKGSNLFTKTSVIDNFCRISWPTHEIFHHFFSSLSLFLKKRNANKNYIPLVVSLWYRIIMRREKIKHEEVFIHNYTIYYIKKKRKKEIFELLIYGTIFYNLLSTKTSCLGKNMFHNFAFFKCV